MCQVQYKRRRYGSGRLEVGATSKLFSLISCSTTLALFMCALANALPKEIAFYCNCGVLAREEADPLKSARQFNGPGGKRRRIDPEFKEALVNLSVSDTTKPNTAATFTGTCTPQTATDCIVKALKSSKLACQEQMRCTGAVCMADDSSGHGKPSESTLMSIIFDGNAKLTAAGQPVVFHPTPTIRARTVCLIVATPTNMIDNIQK